MNQGRSPPRVKPPSTSKLTRRQHLTAFGEDYYSRCKEILRLVSETDAQAQLLQLAPAGKLRVSAPVTFGTEALMPALSVYLNRHPEVSVDIALSDRVVDLVEDGFEVAIRNGVHAKTASGAALQTFQPSAVRWTAPARA